jgi:hypothetical protein
VNNNTLFRFGQFTSLIASLTAFAAGKDQKAVLWVIVVALVEIILRLPEPRR